MAIWLLARPQDCIEENIYWQKLLTRTSSWSSSKEDWKSNFRVTDYHNITSITASPLSPLSQHHHDHNITTITTSPRSQYHHDHNITTITIPTISPLPQCHHYITTISPLSQYHHYITTITISPLYHHYHNITTISPLSQYHHYHKITARSPLSQYHHYHKITTISPLSQYHHQHMSRAKASFSHPQLLHFLRDVSHESFVFTSSTFRFWRMSRTKASFSHRLLSLVERCLARKLRFHIFHFQILKDVPHESFVFTSSTITCGEMSRTKSSFSTSSTFTFGRKSRTKASFSHLPLPDFEANLRCA